MGNIKFELLIEMLSKFGEAKVICHGNSMLPVIRDGDKVTIIAAEGGEIVAGDIVAVRYKEIVYIHRVIFHNAQTQEIITKGDNLDCFEKYIGYNDLIGIIVQTKKHGPYFTYDDMLLKMYCYLSYKLYFITMAQKGRYNVLSSILFCLNQKLLKIYHLTKGYK